MRDQLELHVRNEISELERVSRALEEFGRHVALTPAEISSIGLAVDELLTNVVSYAFDDGRQHDVRLQVKRDEQGLTIVLDDDGKAFNPLDVPEPTLDTPIENRAIGGLGIHIVRRIVDYMSYERHDGRNVLILRKRLGAKPRVPSRPNERAVAVVESVERGVVFFTVSGRLGARAAASLEQGLRARLRTGANRYVFDCTGLDSLSSAGLRVLLIAAKEATRRGGGVALAGPKPSISQTIMIAGLSALLPGFRGRAQAVAALQNDSSSF
jgi:anti-anti-sigma factor